MRTFNKLHKGLQWSIAFSFVCILTILCFFWINLVSNSKIWILLIFIMVPIIQFLITPLFTLLSWYTYYSPMVVSFGNNQKTIDLHNGSSFDYLTKMSHVQPGIEWKNKMLYYYLSALLNIIHDIENKKLSPDISIRGSSYFLSQRSADKLGFTVNKTSFIEKLNISLNYIDLIWMYSLSNKKLSFPDLKNMTTVKTNAADLLKAKNTIMALHSRLQSNSNS